MFTESEMEDLGSQSVISREPKTQAEDQVWIGEELSAHQRDKMKAVMQDFKDIFHEEPGCVRGTLHTVNTPLGAVVQGR